jgi:hypothetical protein
MIQKHEAAAMIAQADAAPANPLAVAALKEGDRLSSELADNGRILIAPSRVQAEAQTGATQV